MTMARTKSEHAKYRSVIASVQTVIRQIGRQAALDVLRVNGGGCWSVSELAPRFYSAVIAGAKRALKRKRITNGERSAAAIKIAEVIRLIENRKFDNGRPTKWLADHLHDIKRTILSGGERLMPLPPPVTGRRMMREMHPVQQRQKKVV